MCDARLHRQRAERADDVVRGFEITHHAVERAQRHLWIGAQQMAEVRRRDRQHAAAGLGDGAVRIAALTECAQAAKGITLAQQIEYDLVSADAVLEQLDPAMGHQKERLHRLAFMVERRAGRMADAAEQTIHGIDCRLRQATEIRCVAQDPGAQLG